MYDVNIITDEKDILKIFPLFIEWAEENGETIQDLDKDDILEHLYFCYVRGAIMLAKDHEGNAVGVSAIMPQKEWLAKRTDLLTLAFFISPKHRKSRCAALLLQKSKDYARLNNMDLIVSVLTNRDAELKDKFFKMYGLSNAGGTYLYRVN
jgi:hypothetical protein